MRPKIFPSVCRQVVSVVLLLCFSVPAQAEPLDTKTTEIYGRIKAHLDAVPAIDTHDHLKPFDSIQGRVSTDQGTGMTLFSMWQSSYFSWIHPLTKWPESGRFEDWWPEAKYDFDDARATGFYRYLLPAFSDLYDVDFETITDVQAQALNEQIFQNSQRPEWVYDVVTEKSNIELMFIDPYWDRLLQENAYPFTVAVLNVTRLLRGFNPSEYKDNVDSPYRYAAEQELPIETLDDYLGVIEEWLRAGKEKGAVCLKTTSAYERTLNFENVTRERAEVAWQRSADTLSAADIKAFEDFIMWRIVALSAKLELPFQIHTGQARIQGSNPLNLMDLIEANPKTKFILFHGGYPWIGETGAIMMRAGHHVWVDSVWLPTISYTMAKRALAEWLEVMPSSRIMWGADGHHVEGIYAATEVTRQCLAEVLAEKVMRKELREEDAMRIASQVMRDNALALFPQLKERLWKHNGPLVPLRQ